MIFSVGEKKINWSEIETKPAILESEYKISFDHE
jgi:hypothetical protein